MSGAPAVRSDHWITVFICEIKFCNNFYFGDVSHLIIFAGVKRGGGGSMGGEGKRGRAQCYPPHRRAATAHDTHQTQIFVLLTNSLNSFASAAELHSLHVVPVPGRMG